MNPANQFNGFFDNPEKPLTFNSESIRPPLEAIIQTLMMVSASVEEWHKKAAFRLFVCQGLSMAADHMKEYTERNEIPPVSAGDAAFMMLLGDLLNVTIQYASQEEKDKYGGNQV